VNDETKPDAVRPVERSAPIPAGEFDYTFPRASVTVVELSRR
jgi:hypothetical protein